MRDHPSALALESIASGQSLPEVSEHLAGCIVCQAHVDNLTQAIRQPAPADPFLAEVQRRHRTRSRRPMHRKVILGAVALAAAFALVRGNMFRPSASPTELARVSDDRLKGPMVLAVIRERNGVQERMTGVCSVRSGDRLRLEFASAETREIAGGILSKNGEWFELEAAREFDKGTHFSNSAVRIDDAGLEGYAIAGSPEDVERARHGERASLGQRLVSVQIVPERGPPP